MKINFQIQRPDILKYLELQQSAMDDEFATLDDKAQRAIGIMSIVTAIIGGFSLTENLASDETRTALGLTIAIYVVAFIIAFIAQWPRNWITPVDPSLEEVKTSLEQTDEDFYQYVIDSYIKAIKKNQKTLQFKALLVRIATGLIGLTMFIIFCATIYSIANA